MSSANGRDKERAGMALEASREAGALLRHLDGPGGQSVRIRSISLDAIEPDPNQPRTYKDPTELQELADSLVAEGLLQEPAVYPVELNADGMPIRFRLLFGERRWSAARLAGWSEIRCKVIPKEPDESLAVRLKRIDQQAAENARRSALSAVEEARSIKAKLETLEAMNPSATRVGLVAQIAADRHLDETTVWRLLALLEAPESLQEAVLKKQITSREVAFLLATHWKDLHEKQAGAAQRKREVQFRNRVQAWAQALGLELNAETLKRYAAEQCLDPKLVKDNLRAAEKIEGAAAKVFDEVVATAVREVWTVQKARAKVRGWRAADSGKGLASAAGLFERTQSKGKARFTVHLERLRDPAIATRAARDELAVALRELLAEVEGVPSSAVSVPRDMVESVG